jgi:hypothetical protein
MHSPILVFYLEAFFDWENEIVIFMHTWGMATAGWRTHTKSGPPPQYHGVWLRHYA